VTRRWLMVVPRLAALLGTSYFLLATSAPVEPNRQGGSGGWGGSGGSGGSSGSCSHAGESLRFHVTGTCGPEGDIVVSSPANECAIMVQGAAAVGLPAAGRFDTSYGGTVSLRSTAWHLSGYLAEGDATGTGQSDAAVFTVVRDAGTDASGPVRADAGIFTVVADAGADARVFTVVADASADTRVFTVVADAGTDARIFTVVTDAGAAPHGQAVLRTCARTTDGVSLSLACSDDQRAACAASLTTLP